MTYTVCVLIFEGDTVVVNESRRVIGFPMDVAIELQTMGREFLWGELTLDNDVICEFDK